MKFKLIKLQCLGVIVVDGNLRLFAQANCSERQVQEFFTRLKKSVRDFLHKLQRKSYDIPAGSHAMPAAPGIPSSSIPQQRATEIINLEGEN